MSRARSWCFTLNNWTEEQVELLDQFECRYMVYGKEVGESGTPHLQGYFYVENAATMTALKKRIGIKVMHLEATRGSPEQNRAYCIKDGDYVERGEIPSQGNRTDIQVVKDIVSAGGGMRQILNTDQVNVSMIKIAEKYLTYCERPRTWKPYVKWIYGPTGVGKSYKARQELGDDDFHMASETNQWWDGYDGQANVLIDDMRADFCKFHVLLRLLDRYEYRVQIKGGYRQFLAKKIYITSCYSPKEMYAGRTTEDVSQLLRRIDDIEALGYHF